MRGRSQTWSEPNKGGSSEVVKKKEASDRCHQPEDNLLAERKAKADTDLYGGSANPKGNEVANQSQHSLATGGQKEIIPQQEYKDEVKEARNSPRPQVESSTPTLLSLPSVPPLPVSNSECKVSQPCVKPVSTASFCTTPLGSSTLPQHKDADTDTHSNVGRVPQLKKAVPYQQRDNVTITSQDGIKPAVSSCDGHHTSHSPHDSQSPILINLNEVSKNEKGKMYVK